MKPVRLSPILAAVALAAAACASTHYGASAPIPGGSPGVGFDDLRYSTTLHRILAPAGRAGTLALVDPDSLAVTTVQGFAGSGFYNGGHDDGPTSVDDGRGLLFVT